MKQPRPTQRSGISLLSLCCWLQSNCGTCWDWTPSCTWSQPPCSEPGLIFQASCWSWPSCSWLTPLLWGVSHTLYQHVHWFSFYKDHVYVLLCETWTHLKAVADTEVNFVLYSLTWCMDGSCTPIGLCWLPHRPWSACSLVFLITKRFVWDYLTITAHYVS